MALQATDINDLVKATLENVLPLKFTDISSELRRYVAMNKLMKKGKVEFDSGVNFNWDLLTGDNGSATFKGLYAQDVVNPTDGLVRGTVPWRHVGWNWAIERREIAMNRSPRQIVRMVELRRIQAFISAVKLFEVKFWRAPASTDTLNPYGVPYWVVKNNTEGFYGQVPSGYTTVGGLTPSSYPVSDGYKWANYTAQYNTVSKTNLIRLMRRAAEYTDWETPVAMPTPGEENPCGIYTNWSVLSTVVELLEAQNDDLGNDVASMDGKAKFMQSMIEAVPQLDEDTTNPVYGLNFGQFKCCGLRGEWLNESKQPQVAGQHTVAANFVDCSLNFFTYNRRRHYVIATGTTMPS